MKNFQKRRAQDLFDWLEIATEKLTAPALDRISADIASHYEEAVDGHLQNGLPIVAAQAAALDELGDAKAAARRFRREHLTESEFRAVTALFKPAWRKSMLLAARVLFYIAGGCALYAYRGFSLSVSLVLALFIGNQIGISVLARRKSPRFFVLMESVSFLNLAILFTLSVSAWDGHLVFSLSMLAYSLRYFQLSNKLGRVSEDSMAEAGEGREIPPENPIVS